MNADRLLVHYEKIADSPDAIPRLRCFILDLAVRGKLVPQDPAEEPASELLKRIAAEKARLVKAGKSESKKIVISAAVDDSSCYLRSLPVGLEAWCSRCNYGRRKRHLPIDAENCRCRNIDTVRWLTPESQADSRSNSVMERSFRA